MRRGRCAWILVCAALLAGDRRGARRTRSAASTRCRRTSPRAPARSCSTRSAPGGALTASAPDIALAASRRTSRSPPTGASPTSAASDRRSIPFARVGRERAPRAGRAGRGRRRRQRDHRQPAGHAGAPRADRQHRHARDQRRRHARGAEHVHHPRHARPAIVRSLAMTADGRSLYASDTTAGIGADLAVRRRPGHRRRSR